MLRTYRQSSLDALDYLINEVKTRLEASATDYGEKQAIDKHVLIDTINTVLDMHLQEITLSYLQEPKEPRDFEAHVNAIHERVFLCFKEKLKNKERINVC